jgi:uncharacterized protein with PQ loop repeat
MTPSLASIFGFCGSVTAACLFLPQVWASHRTKKTQQIAWTSIVIGLTNALFWTIYGLMKNDPFIYVTNIVSFFGAFLLMLLKRKHG